MTIITRVLKRKVSTDNFDIRCAQTLCFAGGVFVLALGSWKLNTFALTAVQILCGLLLVSSVALLLVALGLLLPLAHAAGKNKECHPFEC